MKMEMLLALLKYSSVLPPFVYLHLRLRLLPCFPPLSMPCSSQRVLPLSEP